MKEERPPLWQFFYDDLFWLFLLGIGVPILFYTIWGLIELGNIPIAR